MEEYNLYWLDGTKETAEGLDIADAMTMRGYSHGAVRALDFYANTKTDKGYKWNKETRSWNPDGWNILD